ncbi:MAG: hypothetical protein J2P25_12740, partial [Nocardiopsaceae bacterium]|nr:hypothetical protein [Nocardiopsaceae bacterium]
GGEDREPAGDSGAGDAVVVRSRKPLAGRVSVRATPLPGPWQAARLAVEVTNQTETEPEPPRNRDDALPRALVAAHMIITVSGGSFLSMTDPPEWASAAVAECESAGCWPVLAGPKGSRHTMLASPIILPDYPEVAAESPGELYDGTEIDEILTLRTLALSDEEKAEARATDPRAAALIDRVEAMDAPTMEQLHGTIRSMAALRPAGAADSAPGGLAPGGTAPGNPLDGAPGGVPVWTTEGADLPWWDPAADASVSPGTDFVVLAGQRVARGSRVVLRPGRAGQGRPGRRADAQDMFLDGREALVEAVLQDVDGEGYLAVSLVDDPGADIRSAHGRFLYFSPDEVELP